MPVLDPAAWDATPVEDQGAGVEGLAAPVAQVERDASRIGFDLRADDDERRVVHLDRDAPGTDLEVVGLAVGPEVRVEVPEDARMGDLDALVVPQPVAVDPEETREARVRDGRGVRFGRGHAAGAVSSKLTLVKVTVPSGSGHWP